MHHKPTGKRYYGAKYGRDANPSLLWIKYFSSSMKVKNLRKRYGDDSFEFQVRKTFKTREEAVIWESKFLTRINAASRDDWLNDTNGHEHYCASERRSEETCKKISLAKKGSIPWNKGKTGLQKSKYKGKQQWSLEDRKKIAERSRRENLPLERRLKMSEKKKGTSNPCYNCRWIHNAEGKHKRIPYDEIETWTNDGWVEGRLIKRNERGVFC